MENLMLFIFIGLGLGCIYGLVGLMIIVTFNAANIINLAVGEFVMFGAVIAAVLIGGFNLSFFSTFLLIVIGAILLGILLNWLIVTPLLDKNTPIIIIIIGTYAGALLMSGTTGTLTDFAFLGRVENWLRLL